MSKWKTKETITTTREREWELTVCDSNQGVSREEYDGGQDPTAADYIAALNAEPVEVRIEVLEGMDAHLLEGRRAAEVARDQARSDLATVTAERDSLRASFAEERARSHKAESVFVDVLRKLCEQMGADEHVAPGAAVQVILDERDSLRARLDEREAQLASGVAAIAAEDESVNVGCHAECYTSPDGARMKLVGPVSTLWSPLPRVLAEITRTQPGALLAAADKLRPGVATDRETRAVMALVEWTRLHDSRYLCGLKKGGIEIRDWFMESSETTALALCDRLGIKVE